MSSRNPYEDIREEQVGLLVEEEQKPEENSSEAFPRLAQNNVSEVMAILSSLSWTATAMNFLAFLVPSFMQPPEERAKLLPAKLHPTAYLDGIRGLAALSVFFHHFFYQGVWVDVGFGAGGSYYNILRLPIIRLLYNGGAAVTLFFLISGYALSYKPTMLMRSGKYKDLASNLSSLTFRRLLRLFMPAVASTFIIVCLIRLGAYEWTRAIAENKNLLKGVRENHPLRTATMLQQWSDWFERLYSSVHVFGWDQASAKMIYYDVHLWTVPVEFRCSLYLFLVLLGTSRLQPLFRYMTVGVCMAFALAHDRWDFTLFMVGMCLAEFDHIQGIHARPSVHRPSALSRSKKSHYLWLFACFIGLYFLSRPSAAIEKTPGWIWICGMFPKWWKNTGRYFKIPGAALFVMAVGRLPGFQRFFNRPTVQYFARISYSLYLVHGPVIHVVGYRLEALIWGITGFTGAWYYFGLCISCCFTLPFAIWAADVFWRAFDSPTASFAKWLEGEMIKQD